MTRPEPLTAGEFLHYRKVLDDALDAVWSGLCESDPARVDRSLSDARIQINTLQRRILEDRGMDATEDRLVEILSRRTRQADLLLS